MAYALITGASGGIGFALAKELASLKHDVLLVARSADLLKRNCDDLKRQFGVNAAFLTTDLAQPNAVEMVQDWIQKNHFDIDILINNAGFASWGPLKELPMSEIQGMMALNMNTLAGLSKTLIPNLEQHPRAYIMNVSSTAAYQAVPTLSTYAATKAFVLLFTRGLKWELKGTNISVSCLSPGPTSTGFIDRANLGMMKEKAEKFSMKPEQVAKIAVKGMFAGKAEIIPGAVNWISAKFAELVPKVLTEKIAMNLYKVDR